MKKIFAFLAAVAFALCLSAAEVVEFSNFKGGEFDAGRRGGKLTRVEVFAPAATGSVSLQSVYSAPVFTNVVEVESASVTNVTVVSSNRTASVWRTVPVESFEVVVYTNAAFGTVHTVTNVVTSYTNVPNQVVFTNVYPAVGFSFRGWRNAHPVETLVSSNVAVSVVATTNVAHVVDHYVAVTNSIISGGSVSGHKYGGAPASDTWIAPGERLIYSGPTGGFLRLIVE